MKIWIVALLLLAGCAEPSSTEAQTGDEGDSTKNEEEATTPILNSTTDPWSYNPDSWNEFTYSFQVNGTFWISQSFASGYQSLSYDYTYSIVSDVTGPGAVVHGRPAYVSFDGPHLIGDSWSMTTGFDEQVIVEQNGGGSLSTSGSADGFLFAGMTSHPANVTISITTFDGGNPVTEPHYFETGPAEFDVEVFLPADLADVAQTWSKGVDALGWGHIHMVEEETVGHREATFSAAGATNSQFDVFSAQTARWDAGHMGANGNINMDYFMTGWGDGVFAFTLQSGYPTFEGLNERYGVTLRR